MKKVFEAIVPGWTGDGMPKEFPAYVRFFLRASVALVHIFSIAEYARLFGMLSETRRLHIIQKMYHHPNAGIRNIVQFWKLTALMTKI